MKNKTARREIESLDYYLQNHTNDYSEESHMAMMMAIKALEQESIAWIVGKDNCQVAVRNMPIDKMQKICAIIEEEGQQLCEDCISRGEALRHRHLIHDDDGIGYSVVRVDEIIKLPPVTPSIKKWLSSFNADSATECFTAVQELKKLYLKEVEE